MSSCQKALPLKGHVPLWPRPGRRVASTFYGYDAVGRLTRLVQAGLAGGHAVAEKRVEFAYNAASQFTQLTRYADAGRPGCLANRGVQEAVAGTSSCQKALPWWATLRRGRVVRRGGRDRARPSRSRARPAMPLGDQPSNGFL